MKGSWWGSWNVLRSPVQAVLVVSTVVGSWLGMQAAHEAGHVLAAVLTGGEVHQVVLHPLTISHTELIDNPHPLVVVWAGPLVGVALPLVPWGGLAAAGSSGAFVARFFAGFCLVANGAYIGVGSFLRVGDPGEMIRLGSPDWVLWLFGALAVPAGLRLWNGQGPKFGLGPGEGTVPARVAWGTLAACVGLVIVGLVVGGK